MRYLLRICLLFVAGCLAGDTEDRGLEIAQEVDTRDRGFVNHTANMRMILETKSGKQSKREIRVRTLEGNEEGDKSLIIFDTPRDVKGTALLTFSHVDEPDDQWLYLPALKRVKRISSRNKSGPFMGSEFSFEDMSSQEVGKYTYKYLRDETVGGEDCFVVERYPKDKYSGYTKQIFWVDKTEYRPIQTHYYDRKKSHVKTLSYTGYQQYLDKYWRPDRMTMVNHQSGKKTVLEWSAYVFKADLRDSDFKSTALPRLR